MLENSSIPTPKLSAAAVANRRLMQIPDLHTTLEDYRLAGGAGSRNRETAFELTLKSANALLGR
jgi:hypothetical protein